MEILNVSRPRALRAPQGGLIPFTFQDLAYQGDLNGGSNLIYIGYARPGSLTSSAVWQIKKITYSGTTPIAIQWPVGSDGAVSNDFDQVWNDRSSLVFA